MTGEEHRRFYDESRRTGTTQSVPGLPRTRRERHAEHPPRKDSGPDTIGVRVSLSLYHRPREFQANRIDRSPTSGHSDSEQSNPRNVHFVFLGYFAQFP